MSLSREASAAAQRHAIATIEGLDLVFESMTGGGASVEYEIDDYEGCITISAGRVRAEEIVLTTALAPFRDLGWLRKMKRSLGTRVFTITRQWTDANGMPVGEPELHPQCLLVGYTNPDSAPSSDDAVFSLTFATAGEAL